MSMASGDVAFVSILHLGAGWNQLFLFPKEQTGLCFFATAAQYL